MPWIMQMLGFGLLLLGIGIALWVSFWLLVVLAVVGISFAVWVRLKEFLLAKGILNPTPGVPPVSEYSEQVTIVDADFTRVDQKLEKLE